MQVGCGKSRLRADQLIAQQFVPQNFIDLQKLLHRVIDTMLMLANSLFLVLHT